MLVLHMCIYQTNSRPLLMSPLSNIHRLCSILHAQDNFVEVIDDTYQIAHIFTAITCYLSGLF